MRLLPAALCLLLAAPVPAAAAPSEDWSARLKAEGLAGTEAALAALAAPTPDDLFALGGVRFLRGVEKALQARWRHGATASLAPLPVLRLALPPNPAPAPWTPELVTEIFRAAGADMDAARGALAAIPPGAEIGVTVRLADIWLDIDGNGSEGPGEALLPLVTGAVLNPWEMDPAAGASPPAIRFDAADAAWLSAYTHLIGAVADLVVAFDPTAPTEEVFAAGRDREQRFSDLYPSSFDISGFRPWLDQIAVIVLSLRQQPDPARTASAKAHLLAMVEDNTRFWSLVAKETDNEAEWIPNASQTSALGVQMPPETGTVWMGVLAELREMLRGERVISHPGLPGGAGIDIGAWLDKPSPIDILGWAHGMDALPYAKAGPPLTGEAWWRFTSMMEGRGLMYALILN